MNNLSLELDGIFMRYEQMPLLNGISLSLSKDETICLLGPSGSGKSTLLRIIAGLEQPEAGRVLWHGEDITAQPPHLRNFSLMFQDYALFPHLTVSENIAFGLRMQKRPPREISGVVARALRMVRMESFAQRRVTELSGGEQQRVALARALAPEPRLLMLDEPLGALDRTLRDHLMSELRLLLNKIDIPVIYVTHDQQEAFNIADRLLVLHDGRILQSGAPEEVYSRPGSPWLAQFFGFDNALGGRVVDALPLTVETLIGRLVSDCSGSKLQPGMPVSLVIKPDALQVDLGQGVNALGVKVLDSIFAGDHYRTLMQFDSGNQFEFNLDAAYPKGAEMQISLDPSAILCYPDSE